MHISHPVDPLIEAVRTRVVGYERDGVRVLDATFRASRLPEHWDEPSLVTTLVVTDPPHGEHSWPRDVTWAIKSHAYDELYAVNPFDIYVLVKVTAEHSHHKRLEMTR